MWLSALAVSPEVSSPEQPMQEHLRSTYCRSLWGLMYLHHIAFGQLLLQPLCFNIGLSGWTLQRMCQVYPKSNSHFCSCFLLASAGYQQISVSYQRGEDGRVLRPRKCLSDNFSGESQGRKSSRRRVGSIHHQRQTSHSTSPIPHHLIKRQSKFKDNS